MTDKELLQQALDALTKLIHEDLFNPAENAIEAIKARLAQPEPEPVAWVYPDGYEALKNKKCWTVYGTHQNGMMRPLYAAPSKKEWVSLTDKEVKQLSDYCVDVRDEIEFIRAIEEEIKEKNNG